MSSWYNQSQNGGSPNGMHLNGGFLSHGATPKSSMSCWINPQCHFVMGPAGGTFLGSEPWPSPPSWYRINIYQHVDPPFIKAIATVPNRFIQWYQKISSKGNPAIGVPLNDPFFIRRSLWKLCILEIPHSWTPPKYRSCMTLPFMEIVSNRDKSNHWKHWVTI